MCVRHRRLWKSSAGWGHLRGLRWVVQLGRLTVCVLGVVGRFGRWLWVGVQRVGRGLLVTVGRRYGTVGRLVHLWRHGGVLMSRHVRHTRRHRHLHICNEKQNKTCYISDKTVSWLPPRDSRHRNGFSSLWSTSCYTMTQRFTVLRTKRPMSFFTVTA